MRAARRPGGFARALTLTLLVLVGCGRRGDPLAPGKRLPGAPSALSLAAADGRLTLSWGAPREDLAGRALLPLGGYAVLRESWAPGAGSCERCPEALTLVGTLDSEERRALRLPETSWSDDDVRAGWTYRYRVRALDAAKTPGALSSPATVTWTPLEPPAVQGVSGDGQATLEVKAPVPEGVRPEGIRVYGGPRGGKLAEAGPGQGRLVVSNLVNGAQAVLRVCTVGRTAEGWFVESAGTWVAVEPRDTTPPLPPTDLVAFTGADGVELRWMPSGKEPYRRVVVLRATEAGRFEECATLPGDALAYRDRAPARATVYRYTVVALDEVGNRSLPAREARVSVP